MSASFYDLLKYAATGIASPDMTYYDRMRASTLMGGVVQTLTGIPPLSFKSDGSPLISWSMKGNGQQTGTPTPDNPVMPDFVGVRTEQIIDYTLSESGGIDMSGNPVAAGNLWRSNVFYKIHGSIVLSFVKYSTLINVRVNYYDANYSHISREEFSESFASGVSLTIPTNAKYFKWTLYASSRTNINVDFVRQCYIMFNLGSTALPYEPYGWAEKITCAGQTVPVYLGQVSTVRRVKKVVFDGTENLASGSVIGQISYTTPQSPCIPSIGLCSHYIVKASVTAPFNFVRISYASYNNGTIIWFELERDQYSTKEEQLAAFKQWLAQQYAAGTPVTVWYVLAEPSTGIVNEPLCKIGTYADELSSEYASVTIPTVKGSNTLTVDTELQPSEMSITYRG